MTQWPPSSEIVPPTGTIVPSWETPAVFQNFVPPAQGREAGGGSGSPVSFCRGHGAWPLWPPHRGVWTTRLPWGGGVLVVH